MGDRVKVNDRFTVGTGKPTKDTFDDLARQGFGAVVNLRTRDEANQPLDPDAEGEAVRALGMEYRHLPVPGDRLAPERVDAFRDAVRALPGPVFVHCASGVRSGAFTVMHVAVEEGQTGDEAVDRARALDLPITSPPLAQFVRSYVDSH